MTSNKTLWIVTAETEPEGPVRRGGIPRGPGGSGVRAVEVNKLQANLRGFLDAVQEMLAVEPPAIGDFRLEEVEIGAEITTPRYLATLENIFVYIGQQGHEICLIYAAALVDASLYEQEWIAGQEDDGTALKAVWMPIDQFRNGQAILYPDGLLPLLTSLT